MRDLDQKEGWTPKNWRFWTMVLKKILESHLDCKEIKSVNPKENQSWTFTRRTDAETEAPILWPLHAKSWLIARDPDAGKDGRQEEKETTEDEMVGWHHWFNGHEFEQAPGDGRTGKPGALKSTGSQTAGHSWATEQQQGCLCDLRTTATRLLWPWDSPGRNTGAVAMPPCRGSSRPREQTRISYVSCTSR